MPRSRRGPAGGRRPLQSGACRGAQHLAGGEMRNYETAGRPTGLMMSVVAGSPPRHAGLAAWQARPNCLFWLRTAWVNTVMDH